MDFVHQGFWALTAGGAIPIIIHLLNRQRYRRIRWGAMQFLLNAIKKTQRRIRLENLILLLIRIMIMVLLAFAIMRPFFRESPLAALETSNTNYIFVIDNSFSMGYKKAQSTSLDVAKKAALKLLDEIKPSSLDRFTVLQMSRYPICPRSCRNMVKGETAKQRITDIGLTDYGTSVPNTFAVLDDVIKSSENIDKKIYLFTDMQKNSWDTRNDEEQGRFKERMKAMAKNEHLRFYLIDVGDEDPVNSAVVQLVSKDRVITTRTRATFTAVLQNFSNIPIENLPVSLFVDGEKQETKHATLDGNKQASVSFQHQFREPGPHYVKVETLFDALSKDDARYLAVDVKENIKLLFIDGKPGPGLESETKFLQLALDPAGDGRHFSVEVRTPESFPSEELDKYDGMVLANVHHLQEEQIERIREFVKSGGGLLITLGERIQKEFYNKELYQEGKGLLPAALVEQVGSELAKVVYGKEPAFNWTKIAFEHPMFRTMREDKLRGALYQIDYAMFWKVEKYDPNQVVVFFTDPVGLPTFIEKPYGEGRVMLYTSTIDDAWNLLPKRPVYLVLMHDLMHHLAARPSSNKNVFVGEGFAIRLSLDKRAKDFSLDNVDPGPADRHTLAPDDIPEQARFFTVRYKALGIAKKEGKNEDLENDGIERVGIYALTRNVAGETKPLAYFSCNVAPRDVTSSEVYLAEGNLERVSMDELKTKYSDLKVEFIGKKTKGEAEVPLPKTGGIGKLLAWLVLGFLVMESILACLFGRNKE